MLGSCRFSNQRQDHCFSKQVYAVHLSNANHLTNRRPLQAQLKQNFFGPLLTNRPFHTKSYQKGKTSQAETLFSEFLISLPACRVLWML